MNKESFFDISKRCIIAIDGTSASGKGTIASLIAERFTFLHCQTSIFYRAIALEVIKLGISEEDTKSIIELSQFFDVSQIVNNKDLYSDDVTKMSSIVASVSEVRNNLYDVQRNFILHNKRVVMEGRDIGTVIAPDADLKIYITANLEVRANRRLAQMLKNGQSSTVNELISSLSERDERDQNRSYAPLSISRDAIVIDSSHITPDEILSEILKNLD